MMQDNGYVVIDIYESDQEQATTESDSSDINLNIKLLRIWTMKNPVNFKKASINLKVDSKN